MGIYNVLRNDYIWYHSTPNGLVKHILQEGLKINSIPEFQSHPEPWIYVSTYPFCVENGFSTFEIDLSYLSWDKAGWPFNTENDPIETRWQLRVLENIPSDKLKLLDRNQAIKIKQQLCVV